MEQQGSPPLRRPRYRDRNEFSHPHHQTFLPSPPPVAHTHSHSHQSTVVMDINQVRTDGLTSVRDVNMH